VLTFDAVSNMLAQILPLDQQRTLDEIGAIEHELPPPSGMSERFTVIAARGGEDVWVEVRRQAPQAPAAPELAPSASEIAAAASEVTVAPEMAGPVEPTAAESHLDPLESIVVALPGDEVEEVRLSAVADHAIPLVDDEPQGLPTEAEVDAMLAATAAALLTSGLSSGPDGIDDLTIDQRLHDDETELDLPLVSTVAPMMNIAVEPAEPAFELSPPTAVALLDEDEDEAESGSETIDHVAVGTPLFSDEAMLAAAAPADSDAIAEPPVPPFNAGPEPAAPELAPDDRSAPTAEIPMMDATPEPRRDAAEADRRTAPSSVGMPEPAYAAHASTFKAQNEEAEDGRQAVVVPLTRSAAKSELAAPFTPSEDAALMQTLRAAAARGASTVYVVAQSKPMIRVDGEISALENEPVLTAADVERLVLELAPPRRREALQSGPVEWLCDVPEIGRVRCLTFRDHRGPGVLFRMLPPRAISADQLGLPPEVQALCQQSDGLVLVTGGRASGKSTLLNAFVDLINRTRSDHLVTIETQIGFVHESRRSFISQRETRGDVELAAAFARAALREDLDVMVIEDLKSAEMVAAALEAAESGRLVLASTSAASAIGALERVIDIFPAERRPKARMSLATSLRGVLAQVLLRKIKGGQIAAREILLNTPGVSTLVLEGKMFQLPAVLDGGRRLGMVPLTDSLVGHVREGTVQAAEAYRKALDRSALLAQLKREGIDTSFAERLA
jgi:twitching motility protein PilT